MVLGADGKVGEELEQAEEFVRRDARSRFSPCHSDA